MAHDQFIDPIPSLIRKPKVAERILLIKRPQTVDFPYLNKFKTRNQKHLEQIQKDKLI